VAIKLSRENYNSLLLKDVNTLKRKYYKKSGGRPFLFYVVFGYGLPVSIHANELEKYNIDEGIEELRYVNYNSDEHLVEINTYRSGPIWEQLVKEDKEFAEKIYACEECVIIMAELEDRDNFNYMNNVIGVLTYIINNGGVGIYDMEKIDWWKLEEWTKQVFEIDEFNPYSHIVILRSEQEDGQYWYHTRGMRKFGRSDLSIHNVSIHYFDAVTDMFNRFIDYLAHGGMIEDYQEIRMNKLPEGMWCLNKGDLEDFDFNNTHIEINWK